MVLRSGKYKGWTITALEYSDPGYLRWVRLNRPEMLIERVTKKPIRVEMTDEEIEQKTSYKDIPRMTWDQAF